LSYGSGRVGGQLCGCTCRHFGSAIIQSIWSPWSAGTAGYSAGACILSPSLRGLELVDDAEAVTRIYGSQPSWDGMALLHEAFVPHYRSPGHPETAAIERVVTRYRAEGIAYRTLHDGQALLVNGPETKIV
jgi:dipeptidase E